MKLNLTAAVAASVVALAGSAAQAATYNFAPLAGQEAILDHTDGAGTNARFYNPNGIAIDSAGNVYVADTGDHTVRVINSSGVSSVLAGLSGAPGNVDGAGTAARLDYPYAVAVDSAGSVYVTDILDNSVRKITGGQVTTIATGFSGPQGIAVDGSNNVYVADTNNSVIKVIKSGVVSIYAGTPASTGTADGTGTAARFNYPAGLATDAAGNVYVADFDNSSVRVITGGGGAVVTTIAGSTSGAPGSANGVGTAATFNHPAAVSVDGAGNVYVVDTSNQLIREIAANSRSVTTVAGTLATIGAANGAGATATFFYPQGIAAASSGKVYVADTGNHSIRLISLSPTVQVGTLAGSVGVAGFANGSDGSATFRYPYGVAVDGAGNVYVADSGNNAIRKISGGNVSTLAGSATGLPGSANGTGAAATFNSPSGVAVDGAGNVYVADTGNNAVRKITAAGVVSTFAGGFSQPQGIAVDKSGNVYVADTGNNIVVELTVGPTGALASTITLAGASGQSGASDSTAGSSARFNRPNALAVDSSGNVYVSDFGNSTIRKIAATTTSTTTLAGAVGQIGVADGSGGSARFNQVYGVAVDGSSNAYVTDTLNRVIRQISPTGVVTTVSGTQARFLYPEGIAIDGSGNLYVADADNNSISEGVPVATASTGLANHTVAVGGTATFAISPVDSTASYAWQVLVPGTTTWTAVANGGVYSGASNPSLTITGATAAMNGYEYRAVATNSLGVSTSPIGTLYVGTARLLNLSSSGLVSTGSNDLAAGFVISGTGTKQILLRGIGPTLASFGVSGTLATPMLTLYTSSSAVQATDTAWGGTATLTQVMSAVGAFTLPSNSADSALYIPNLGTGTHTTHVDGVGGATGVALVEVYDADPGTPTARLSNISTSAPVGAVNLVAGFVIGGSTSETILIRGVGPGLGTFGYAGVLSNVQLTLYDSKSNVIGSNNGWGGSTFLQNTFASVSAFPLQVGSLDSAMVVTLAPGSYTATVSGVGGAAGTALVEIYEVP